MLSLGVIGGAIYFHLTRLGIALPAVEDHGELFALAMIVFVCSLALLAMHRLQARRGSPTVMDRWLSQGAPGR